MIAVAIAIADRHKSEKIDVDHPHRLHLKYYSTTLHAEPKR